VARGGVGSPVHVVDAGGGWPWREAAAGVRRRVALAQSGGQRRREEAGVEMRRRSSGSGVVLRRDKSGRVDLGQMRVGG
jgi:hypothetical protein